MSKSSHRLRFEALQGWLEQIKKNAKYGKPKRVVIDDDIDIQWKPKKRY
jgi:hypothetical protein